VDPAICGVSRAAAPADDGSAGGDGVFDGSLLARPGSSLVPSASSAVTANVSASRQNQAFSALLFLYANVLEQPLGPLQVARAKRPRKLPVVLTKDEVNRLLAQVEGTEWLMARGGFRGQSSYCDSARGDRLLRRGAQLPYVQSLLAVPRRASHQGAALNIR
jgi:integrase